MIPNIHQSVDEIIKESSPAQKILWQQIRLITGENAAIRQTYFNGSLVGSEFNTAGNPRRIYLAYNMYLNHNIGAPSATLMQFSIDGMNFKNIALGWDATAAAFQYMPLTISIQNIMFSLITTAWGAPISQILFTGYRITY